MLDVTQPSKNYYSSDTSNSENDTDDEDDDNDSLQGARYDVEHTG